MRTDAQRPRKALRTPAWRTLRATFVSSLKAQVRGYTLTGWAVTSVLSPLFLFASAWVILRLLGTGPSPPRFHELTGYGDYLAFVVLGVAFQGLATAALEDGGNAVYEEEEIGTWDALALAPFGRFTWMFGKTLAGVVTGFVDFAAVLLVGVWAFERAPGWSGVGFALLGVVATVAALQGLAFAMAAVGLRWKQPYAVAFLLGPVLILLTGMMFPLQVLPGWVQVVAQAVPLTHGLVVVRDAVLLGAGWDRLAPAFARLAASGLVLGVLGMAAFRWMERRARESGALGRY